MSWGKSVGEVVFGLPDSFSHGIHLGKAQGKARWKAARELRTHLSDGVPPGETHDIHQVESCFAAGSVRLLSGEKLSAKKEKKAERVFTW